MVCHIPPWALPYSAPLSPIQPYVPEGRGVVVDIHRSAKNRSHDMTVEEVILYGLPKSGSQREQS